MYKQEQVMRTVPYAGPILDGNLVAREKTRQKRMKQCSTVVLQVDGLGWMGWIGSLGLSSNLVHFPPSLSIIKHQTMSVLKHCCSVSGASVTLVQQMSNIAWVSFDLQEHKIHLLWNIY